MSSDVPFSPYNLMNAFARVSASLTSPVITAIRYVASRNMVINSAKLFVYTIENIHKPNNVTDNM